MERALPAMLRIGEVGGPGRDTTLRLEGRVVGPWVEELRTACERALANGGGLTLDLADVAFLEPRAVQLLRSLRARGVVLTRCSGFLSEQLKG